MSQQAHHRLHVPRVVQFSRNRFVFKRRVAMTLIDCFSPPQPVTVPRARTSPSGTRCCRRRKRWSPVSFRDFPAWTFLHFGTFQPSRVTIKALPAWPTRRNINFWYQPERKATCASLTSASELCGIDSRFVEASKFYCASFVRILNVSQAHDNAIKCLAMDPHEEFFVTGSADGDIKVSFEWKLTE